MYLTPTGHSIPKHSEFSYTVHIHVYQQFSIRVTMMYSKPFQQFGKGNIGKSEMKLWYKELLHMKGLEYFGILSTGRNVQFVLFID